MPDPSLTEASVDELFDIARRSDDETEERWAAVCELHRRGNRETFEMARRLTLEPDEVARILGVDVLAQLGYDEGKPFARESLPFVESLASPDHSPRVVSAAITALGHLKDPSSVTTVLAHVGHPDADVRFRVAWTLPSVCDDPPTPAVLDAFFALMEDEDTEVRDWATFGLGTQLVADSPEIRDALLVRADDTDAVVAGEALHGLAQRHDPRVLAPLLRRLETSDPKPGDLTPEALDLLVSAASDLADPRCLPALQALRAELDRAGRASVVDVAIEACEQSTQER